MPIAKVTGNIIGDRIKNARLKKGLDQVELAAVLDVEHGISFTQRTISDVELKKRSVRDKEIYAFAKALDISPNDLFDWP